VDRRPRRRDADRELEPRPPSGAEIRFRFDRGTSGTPVSGLLGQRSRRASIRYPWVVAATGRCRRGLRDRQAWLLAEVTAELGAYRLTVRRLLDRYGIRRVRRTPREWVASESRRRVQSVGWQERRVARLTELGFADLAGCLKARHVDQGWSVKRMRVELEVGRRWLVGELARLGLRP
jgi:hypothetical protein